MHVSELSPLTASLPQLTKLSDAVVAKRIMVLAYTEDLVCLLIA